MSELKHYGTKRHSGRYPWGSGENPQRHRELKNRVKDMKDRGMSESEIAKELGYSSTVELRAAIRIATNEIKKQEYSEIKRLHEEGYSNSEIARQLGKNESSIRSALKTKLAVEGDLTTKTADVLKNQLESNKYIDIGDGVENHLGISKERLKTAVEMLKAEGYEEITVAVNQMGTKDIQKTKIKVLAPPGTTYSEINQNKDEISSTWMLEQHSEDGGVTFRPREAPQSIDSERVFIRYSEDGGTSKDGVIEIRPGCEDLDLGQAKYAQVRIAVDDKYYLKGMAVYNKDIPEGFDIVYNSNKSKDVPKEKVFKEMNFKEDGTLDINNPFGAMVKDQDDLRLVQKHYTDKDGNEKLNAINIVNEQGDWNNWKTTISSQFLSKQLPSTAKKQLDLTYSIKQDEFSEIQSMTNPIVKQALLHEFADECDSSAVHLKAAGFPRQQSHVILPINSLGEKEVYAPNYENGEQVVLVRFPHAGRFELPLLTVNNKNKEGKDIIANAPDAVGINPKVAAQLSGADFDGDTVVVIPCNNVNIKTEKAISDLQKFEPKSSYAIPEEKKFTKEEQKAWDKDPKEALKRYPGLKDKIPRMTPKQKGRQMGEVSNLITDMTLKGASQEDIIKAVKHSMTVIDAEKHYLDWKQSEIDNDILALREKYQKKENGRSGGASTLISRAKSPKDIPERIEITNPNSKKYPLTEEEKEAFAEGKKIFRNTGKTHSVPDEKAGVDERGKPKAWKEVENRTEVPKMLLTDDALTLSSGTPMETIYGNFANKLKQMANNARKLERQIKPYHYDKDAAKRYANERSSLSKKLNDALKNKPLERAAQVYANDLWKTLRESNREMDKAEMKKEKAKCLEIARKNIGAKKTAIYITDKEWEAIQSHAISSNQLKRIIDNSDKDRLKELALPRTNTAIPSTKLTVAKARLRAGWTQAEVAKELGISVSTLNNALREDVKN